MLKVKEFVKLPSGKGVAGVDGDGTIVIKTHQAECLVSPEDIEFMTKMFMEFQANQRSNNSIT